MDPQKCRRREDRERTFRTEQEGRDKEFEKLLSSAKRQKWAIQAMMDEEEHEERRGGMREAYLQHGVQFDPHQIQESPHQTSHYEDITGSSQASVGTFKAICDLEEAIDRAEVQLKSFGDQMVRGVRPPPNAGPSSRTIEDILTISPTTSPHAGDQGDDDMGLLPPSAMASVDDNMLLTPTVDSRACLPDPMQGDYHPGLWYRSPQSRRDEAMAGSPELGPDDMQLTPVVTASRPTPTLSAEARALFGRTQNILTSANQCLQTSPSQVPHPLSYSFSSQRQPLATLYSTPRPSTSGQPCPPGDVSYPCPTLPPRATPEPQPGPSGLLPNDPRLTYKPRLPPGSQMTPGPSSGARRRQPLRALATRETVQAAIEAGTFKGTQAEMEIMGYTGCQEQQSEEDAFVDQNITPYRLPPPQVIEETPVRGLTSHLKQGSSLGRKKRVMLKRKVTKITIPPKADKRQIEGAEIGEMEEIPDQPLPYMYTPGHPCYSVKVGELLPPRRLTPSPEGHHYDVLPSGSPRSAMQLQMRRDLETDWDRRQEAVPSREYESDRQRSLNRPLPKAFTTGKKKPHSYRGGVKSCPPPTQQVLGGHGGMGGFRPQAPTTRTGLVLRTPSSAGPTPSTSRGGGAPRGSSSRGGLCSPASRGGVAVQGTSSRGRVAPRGSSSRGALARGSSRGGRGGASTC